ncbi:MAG: hypothetical protein ACFCUT_16880 [Kiloniellaceae bacterium]
MSFCRFLAILLIAVLPLACATPPQTAENSPERVVEETFLAYKEALLAHRGNAAAELVTEESWEYYRDLADEALTANRARLEGADFTDRVTILMFRLGLTREQLRRLSGRELVAKSIDEGWFSEELTARLRLTDYRISGDTARAFALDQVGKPSTSSLSFQRERGAWRLDLLQAINDSRKVMTLAIAISGMTEEELLFATLEEGTGRRPGPEIWNPPI